MSDWTPIPSPNSQKRRQVEHDSVRMYVNGQIALSPDLAERLGGTGYVMPMRNGHRDRIGLRGTQPQPGTSMLKLSTSSGGTRVISGNNILSITGRAIPEATVHLPHHWDGDVLVIDLSGLPDAQGGS